MKLIDKIHEINQPIKAPSILLIDQPFDGSYNGYRGSLTQVACASLVFYRISADQYRIEKNRLGNKGHVINTFSLEELINQYLDDYDPYEYRTLHREANLDLI
jgi:hypothetical protein